LPSAGALMSMNCVICSGRRGRNPGATSSILPDCGLMDCTKDQVLKRCGSTR